MTFNPLEEKGIAIDKQLRDWHDIAKRKFNKNDVNCYSRTRQILMNGIEIEAWNFKHNFSRMCSDEETMKYLAMTKKIEDQQQTTVNWMTPSDQSVLETTLGYEQVAVDLTAWLAQNEKDEYVKETFNFGLLEDFDHLYRYSQWAYQMHGINPDDIVQHQTDVMISRPTQQHHNCNVLRLRKPYNKLETSPETKVHILTVVSAEQQTHNYYAEHGMQYGNHSLRETYAEIKDVEEEHVNMYESLMDPTESFYERALLHEFTEVCNYYNCYEDELNDTLKPVWELFLEQELGHLHYAIKLFEKHEKRDAEEVIGKKIIRPCHFTSQKEYVRTILEEEIDKRVGTNKDYAKIKDLPEDWASYDVQATVNADGSPSERIIRVMMEDKKRDIILADDDLRDSIPELMKRGLDKTVTSCDSVTIEEYKAMAEEEFEF